MDIEEIKRVNKIFLVKKVSLDPQKSSDFINDFPELNFAAYISGGYFPNIKINQAKELNNFVLNLANINTIKQLIDTRLLRIPMDDRADFLEALHLTINKNDQQINRYFKSRKIGLTSENLIGLNSCDRLFILTHFFGTIDKIDDTIIWRARKADYLQKHPQGDQRTFFNSFFKDYKKEFWPFFTAFYDNLNWTNIGAFKKEWFIKDPISYFKLLVRPLDFLPLNLTPLKEMELTEELFSYFSDGELIYLFGNTITKKVNSRKKLIKKVVDHVSEEKVYLLTPTEAGVGINTFSKISLESFFDSSFSFIGIGKLKEGLRLYAIEEIVQSFEINKDSLGIYTFQDPLNYGQSFSLKQLKAIRDCLNSNQFNIPPSQELTELFDKYVLKSKEQLDSYNYPIIFIKCYLNQHQEIGENLKKSLLSLFKMGMFMRQWLGEGHPYPILAKNTGYAIEGSNFTEREIEILERMSQGIKKCETIFFQTNLPQEILLKIWQITPRVKRNGREVQRLTRSFKSLWDEVKTKNYCIRLASAPWCYTIGQIYYEVFGENIGGFDVWLGLDPIS